MAILLQNYILKYLRIYYNITVLQFFHLVYNVIEIWENVLNIFE